MWVEDPKGKALGKHRPPQEDVVTKVRSRKVYAGFYGGMRGRGRDRSDTDVGVRAEPDSYNILRNAT